LRADWRWAAMDSESDPQRWDAETRCGVGSDGVVMDEVVLLGH
jgi:hypothetical protein